MSLTVEKCIQAWTNSLRQMNAKADIVFFGESLTYHGDFSSVFPDRVVCNLGLRGDTIRGMIDRVEQIKVLEPEVLFVMAGINDISNNSLDTFEELYEKLVKRLKELNHNTTIIIQSILPVNNFSYSISCDNEQIQMCNQVIARLSDRFDLCFVNLFSEYIDDVIEKGFTLDGIHLRPEGYIKWYDVLARYLFV